VNRDQYIEFNKKIHFKQQKNTQKIGFQQNKKQMKAQSRFLDISLIFKERYKNINQNTKLTRYSKTDSGALITPLELFYITNITK
jgi:hypothetical protein